MIQIRQSSARQQSVPLVVKVGGSLQRIIPELVPELLSSGRPLLIVPGGGIFADIVRQTRVADDAAHWMAIAAMDQFGWFISSHGLVTTDILAIPEKTTVFLPYTCMRRCDPLPHTWDISSDTISAWVAGALGLDLLVLKSVDGIFREGVLQDCQSQPMICDEVDPFFLPYVLTNKISAAIINGSQPGRVEKYLKGEPVTGTGIGITF